jgi:hypothetical protein
VSEIEAIEWLTGGRSMWNLFADGTPEARVLCAQTDAAMTERAYWVMRAKSEGLVPVEGGETAA